ncbi:MAG: UDP-4-amino-4,6-dideoxy-N-acetyl-beta-L-altrosamine N-acetyltransferase [Aliarcobacter sp.]|nr:UDP-4-amino-4,6-dideoxy-N-acetyl-beta-L-altrosamine N-acetyltransferase [Aliarcobacter sp.]
MENIKLMNFTELTLEQKEMVLIWRNSSEIRKWMYSQEEIELNDHLNFIESLKSRKDKLYFLVKKDKEYIGVIDFTEIIEEESLHMGIYTNPNIKGNGKILLNKIIEYSFDNLKVKKIYSEVFSQNNKAYELYEKYNFKDISKKTINNKEVICMELNNENR